MAEKQQLISRPLTMANEQGDQPSTVVHVSTDQPSSMAYELRVQPSTMVHVSTDQPSSMANEQRDQPSTVVHVSTDQPSTMNQKHWGLPSVAQEQELRHLKTSQKCPKCNVTLYLKNLQRHIKRKHATEKMDRCTDCHLASQCIDAVNGSFAVAKNFCGPPVPVHVKQKLRGPNECEVDDCSLFYDIAGRSGH